MVYNDSGTRISQHRRRGFDEYLVKQWYLHGKNVSLLKTLISYHIHHSSGLEECIQSFGGLLAGFVVGLGMNRVLVLELLVARTAQQWKQTPAQVVRSQVERLAARVVPSQKLVT